jgi:predicted protein tyrosine phosphatase
MILRLYVVRAINNRRSMCEKVNTMSLKEINYVSRREAERMEPRPNWALVSISDPLHYPAMLRSGWHSILRLEFSDVEKPCHPSVIFSMQDAQRVIEFVSQADVAGCVGLLVHCKAGVSRSASIAKWVAMQYQLATELTFAGHNSHVYKSLCEVSGMTAIDGTPAMPH